MKPQIDIIIEDIKDLKSRVAVLEYDLHKLAKEIKEALKNIQKNL